MIEILGGTQATHKVVAVAAIIGGSLDLGEVCHFMKTGCGLVLTVASRCKSRELVEVQVAVSHVAAAWKSIGQNAAGACPIDVGAVVARNTRVCRSTFGGNARKDGRDRVSSAGGRRLEILDHLIYRARAGGSLGRRSETGAVGQSSQGDGQLIAGAITLNAGALMMERNAGCGSLFAVNLGLQGVRLEWHRADQLIRLLLSKRKGARGDDVELSARGEVVHLSNVKIELDGFSRGNALECSIFKMASIESDPNTIELDGLIYTATLASASH